MVDVGGILEIPSRTAQNGALREHDSTRAKLCERRLSDALKRKLN